VAKSHKQNDRSSRSHAVITATVTVDGGAGGVRKGTLAFVDLAGSERIMRSGAIDSEWRTSEAVATNQSLSSLHRVVLALSTKARFVPFRDSTLTKLLQQSLTSQSTCAVLVTVAHRSSELDEAETKSSIRFAKSCKSVSRAGPTRGVLGGSGDRPFWGAAEGQPGEGAQERNEEDAALTLAGLEARYKQVRDEMKQLYDRGQGGQIDPNAAVATQNSWRHNRKELEKWRRAGSVAKQEMLEAGSVGLDAERQAAAQRMQLASEKATVYEGIVARMIYSGLYKNPVVKFQRLQREATSLRQRIRDHTGKARNEEEDDDSYFREGGMVLGDGLSGMIKSIAARQATF